MTPSPSPAPASDHRFPDGSGDPYVPRRIVLQGEDPAESIVPPRVYRLPGYPRERLVQLRANTPSFFECLCVEVEADDGMTASAEAVARALSEVPEFPAAVLLRGSPGSESLPAVTALVAPRELLRIAVAQGLVAPYFSVRSIGTWGRVVLLVVLACVLTVAAALLQAAIGTGAPLLPGGSTMVLALMAVSAVGAAVLGGQILEEVKRSEERGRRELGARLAGEPDPEALGRLTAKLTQMLAMGPFPRAVVVDDFEALDPISRTVLRNYLLERYADRRGAELWVVFEGVDGTRLGASPGFRTRASSRGASRRVLRQQYLDAEERRTLAARHGNPEQWHIPPVKWICTSQDSVQTLAVLVREYRRRFPATAEPEPLKLLYLLALGRGAKEVSLERDFLTSTMISAGVRQTVLEAFMGGPLYPAAVRLQLDQLQERLPAAIRVSGGDLQDRSYTTTPACAELLPRMAGSLGLADPGLGHLFWCLIWHDLQGQRPVEAFWVRQLAHHCLHAGGLSALPSEQRARLNDRLFEVLLYTIRGALQVCLFAPVPRLLERTRELLASDALSPARRRHHRVLQLGWEAYAMLGSDEILRILVELGLMEREAAGPAAAVRSDPGLLLGLELLPQARSTRDALYQSSATPSIRGEETTEVRDHLRARSLWLALSMQEVLVNLRVGHAGTLLQQGLAEERSIPRLFERVAKRVYTQIDASQPGVLDLATLSILLWSGALRLGLGARQHAAVTEAQELVASGILRPVNLSLEADLRTRVEDLLAMAEHATLIGSALHRRMEAEVSARFSGHEFVLYAFAQELASAALAAGVSGCRRARAQGLSPLPAGALGALRSMFEEAAPIFGFVAPPLASESALSSSEVRERVDAALHLCSLLWQRFGFAAWDELLRCRRLQFRVLTTDGDADAFAVEKLGTPGIAGGHARSGLAALLARLTLADAQQERGEVRADHLAVAADLAQADRLGSDLSAELMLIALDHGYSYAEAPLRFVPELLRGRELSRPWLREFLARVSRRYLEHWFLVLCSVYRRLDDATARQLRECLHAVLEEETDEERRNLLRGEVELSELRLRLERGEPVDLEELRRRWAGCGNSAHYAGFLNLMLRYGRAWPGAHAEAMRLLDHDPREDMVDTYLHLALTLGRSGEGSGGEGAEAQAVVEPAGIARFLRLAAPQFSSVETVETKQEIYHYLMRNDPERRELHFAELLRLKHEEAERDHQKRYPVLIARGEFFLLFQDYVRTMKMFGLKYDDAAGPGRLPDPERPREVFDAWVREGGAIPDPLSGSGPDTRIGSRFLALGRLLFLPPLVDDRDTDEIREHFNAAARDHLDALTDHIVSLPALPDQIRAIIRAFRERFERRTPLGAA